MDKDRDHEINWKRNAYDVGACNVCMTQWYHERVCIKFKFQCIYKYKHCTYKTQLSVLCDCGAATRHHMIVVLHLEMDHCPYSDLNVVSHCLAKIGFFFRVTGRSHVVETVGKRRRKLWIVLNLELNVEAAGSVNAVIIVLCALMVGYIIFVNGLVEELKQSAWDRIRCGESSESSVF